MTTTKRREFTWDEYVLEAQQATSAHGRQGDNSEWSGGTFKGAVRMATVDGYSAAVAEVEALIGEISDTVTTQSYQTTFVSTWDVAGAEVDMGRFLAGEPECMIEAAPIRIARQGRAIRLTINVGYQAKVKTEEVKRRGAAVLALVDILSRAQHPLEVWTARAGLMTGPAQRLVYAVKIQDANQPLDMGRVMYAIAHPSYHRHLGFAVMANDGYGFHDKGTSQDLGENDLEPFDAGTAIVLADRLQSNQRWTVEHSVQWIKEQLAVIFDS